METAIAVAIIAALVSVGSVAATVYVAVLQHRFTRARDRETREEALERLVSRYREPLLLATFDLQSRCYNIVRKDFLSYLRAGTPEEQRYVKNNTIFVLSQFFGWVEALRVDVQFLDVGDVARARTLNRLLDAVRSALATDSDPDPRLRIFWGHQRAIGELMLIPRGDGAHDSPRYCVGFAEFSARLDENEHFRRWFERLAQDLDVLASDPNPSRRLRSTQHALIDLIAFLDPPPGRLPVEQLTKA
jgi:hypothetical protein